jgi:hypothetical protein
MQSDEAQDNTTTIEVPDDKQGVYSDWVANCRYAYGFGHTQSQAFGAMAANAVMGGNLESDDSPVQVTFIEHIGEATVGRGRTDVDWPIDGEIIEVSAEELHQYAETARDATSAIDGEGDALLGVAEEVATFDDGEWDYAEEEADE